MDNNNCSNCRYWNETKEEYNRSCCDNVKQCHYAKFHYDCFEWVESEDSDDVNYELTEQYKDQKSFVRDGSDYMAILYTREDYYCNCWEAKE